MTFEENSEFSTLLMTYFNVLYEFG